MRRPARPRPISNGMRTILPAHSNPLLRKTAKDIVLADIKSIRIKRLIQEMKALLAKEEYGVALAAPQVGEPLRLFIVSGKAIARGARSAQHEPGDKIHVRPPARGGSALGGDQIYINPKLIKVSRKKAGKHEGCLSIRGKWGIVPRAEKATIEAYDENGKHFMRGASGFLAHVFQHEMDHLEGILYTDKAKELYDEKEEARR